jgi:two-component system chemotaxis sensor kinase CheA
MPSNNEFIQDFIDEAKEHVTNAEHLLLNFGTVKSDYEQIKDLFRAIHSIKGSAGFFGLPKIVALSHDMESILDKVREGTYDLTDSDVDILLSTIDILKVIISELPAMSECDINPALEDLKAILSNMPNSDKNDDWKTKIRYNTTKIHEAMKRGHNVYVLHVDVSELSNKDIPNLDAFLEIIEGAVTLSGIYPKSDTVGDMLVTTVMDIDIISETTGLTVANIQNVTDYFDAIIKKTAPAKPAGVIQNNLELALEKSIARMQRNAEARENDNKTESKTEVKPKTKTENKPLELSIPTLGKNDKNEKKESVQSETTQPKSMQLSIRQNESKQKESIRVDVDLLNELINLTSELVLGRNQLLRMLEPVYGRHPGLQIIVQNINNLTSGLQECVMQTRMKPLSSVFDRLPRVVRDVSRQQKKDIELTVSGGEVELDRSVVEALADPLSHIARNSIDHGIELPSVRTAAGKSKTGSITFKAYNESGFVIIDIIDDGQGMDVEKIRQKAIEKGRITEEASRSMNDSEIIDLTFQSGFSTADAVTDLSGRGVGMDVVRTNIEKLGGTVQLFSEWGRGTTLRLNMPLTMAIIQALIVETENVSFALPHANLQRIIRVKQNERSRYIEKVGGIELLRLNDMLLPLVRLSEVLNIVRDDDPEVYFIQVLKVGKHFFSLMTDKIVGSEEILVKPLPAALSVCDYYSGVTIIGDGNVAMILDVVGLANTAQLQFVDSEHDSDDTPKTDLVESEQFNFLLFRNGASDDSVHFAIDMSMVSRVEEVETASIEHFGEKMYITHEANEASFAGVSDSKNRTMRVFRIEDYLPVDKPKNEDPEIQYLITTRLSKHPMGILVSTLLDNIQTTVEIDDNVLGEGVLGTITHNDRIIIVIQPYELFSLVAPEWFPKNTNKHFEGKKLLFIEDTQFLRKIIGKYFKNAGFIVSYAKNGAEGWDMFLEEKFDVIVSDINMPVMNGIEFMKKVRSHHTNAGVPSLALTSQNSHNFQNRCMEAGFDQFELKLDEERLISKLKMMVL